MTKAEKLASLNHQLPPCIEVLNGRVIDFDTQLQSCEMRFDITPQFCHSGDIVQGGFVTAMLDAAISHAVFAMADDITALSTLEIKVSFLAPTRAGPVQVVGKALKAGHSMAFLEGTLINSAGDIAARASATAKVIRRQGRATSQQ